MTLARDTPTSRWTPSTAKRSPGLTAALTSLLPPSADPTLAPDLSVSPTRFSTTGLNGFVGYNHEPDGEILGRRVEANAIVGVKTKTVDALNGAVAGVTASVVGAPHGRPPQARDPDIGVSGLGPQTPPRAARRASRRQEVTFDVSYEFLKEPTAASGVIAEIPLDFDFSRENEPTPADLGGVRARTRSPLRGRRRSRWRRTGAPSHWTFDAGRAADRSRPPRSPAAPLP